MDLQFTPEEEAFRQKVRTWLAGRYGEVKHPEPKKEEKPAEAKPEKSS